MSKELYDIVSASGKLRAAGLKMALATVVHVEGSAYRRAGAKMLVDEYGNITGGISGGCLEGDALEKALHCIQHQKAILVLYDTSAGSGSEIAAQLGCEGIIRVLFESVQKDGYDLITILSAVESRSATAVLISVFGDSRLAVHPGTTALIGNNAKLHTELPHAQWANEGILETAQTARTQKKNLFREFSFNEDRLYAFFQFLDLPRELIIFGAGTDAVLLAELAQNCGWKIQVVDQRPSHARAARFAAGCQVKLANADAALNGLSLSSNSYIVFMSHNYDYDLEILAALTEQDQLPYIGVLGPKKKKERLLKDIKARGAGFTESFEEKLFAPMGLDIGADTPQEIALSVLAEITAIANGRDAGHLRARESRIHANEDSRFEKIEL